MTIPSAVSAVVVASEEAAAPIAVTLAASAVIASAAAWASAVAAEVAGNSHGYQTPSSSHRVHVIRTLYWARVITRASRIPDKRENLDQQDRLLSRRLTPRVNDFILRVLQRSCAKVAISVWSEKVAAAVHLEVDRVTYKLDSNSNSKTRSH